MSAPTAMEADKTKEEMTMATIIEQTKEETNWGGSPGQRNGRIGTSSRRSGCDPLHLRSGTEAAIMVEKVEAGRLDSGLDGVAERPMAPPGASVSWKESDARIGATAIWSGSPGGSGVHHHPAPSARPSRARSW